MPEPTPTPAAATTDAFSVEALAEQINALPPDDGRAIAHLFQRTMFRLGIEETVTRFISALGLADQKARAAELRPPDPMPTTVLGRLQHVAQASAERPDDEVALLGLTWRDVRLLHAGLQAAVKYVRSQHADWIAQGSVDAGATNFPPELGSVLRSLTPLVIAPPAPRPEVEEGTVVPVTIQVEIEDGQQGRYVIGRSDHAELPFLVVDTIGYVTVGPAYATREEAEAEQLDRRSRVVASFRATAWRCGQAIEVDPEGDNSWDATEGFWALPLEYRQGLRQRMVHGDEVTDTADALQASPGAPTWVREWAGPFCLYVRFERPESSS